VVQLLTWILAKETSQQLQILGTHWTNGHCGEDVRYEYIDGSLNVEDLDQDDDQL
jgi:hypothetical protein